MIAEHFRNGDRSPPLTAFTADDSYPDKESCREDDPEKVRSTAQVPGPLPSIPRISILNPLAWSEVCALCRSSTLLNAKSHPLKLGGFGGN
jgi:hypothetical protein